MRKPPTRILDKLKQTTGKHEVGNHPHIAKQASAPGSSRTQKGLSERIAHKLRGGRP